MAQPRSVIAGGGGGGGAAASRLGGDGGDGGAGGGLMADFGQLLAEAEVVAGRDTSHWWRRGP